MLQLVEAFKSVQSEGTHAGTPANFIRLFGCNLQCKFGESHSCDEPLHTDKGAIRVYTEMELVKFCQGVKHVVITGGEPSLRNLNDFIGLLQEKGHYVQIETNGAILDNIKQADFITYAPKFHFDDKAPRLQAGFHELKLLAGKGFEPDTRYWESVRNKYIQPIAFGEELDVENIKWCAGWVVQNRGWKLSIQTHKFYGGQ